jgi:hypothetical protein
MTYENWCKHSKEITTEAEKHNRWMDRAKKHLLVNIGPLLADLNRTGYCGCGFHYSLEQTFGRLIDTMSRPWQPTANDCDNVEKDRMKTMATRVSYRSLIYSVKRAKKSRNHI